MYETDIQNKQDNSTGTFPKAEKKIPRIMCGITDTIPVNCSVYGNVFL